MAAAIACTLSGGAALAGGHAPAHGAAHEEIDLEGATNSTIRGVKLGEFHIRAYHPVEAQKSTVRFELYVVVAKEQLQQTRHFIDDHKHKLCDQVVTATRMTPLLLFDEPDLKSFRRRIFIRLRRALPELKVEDIYISDFQLAVQSL